MKVRGGSRTRDCGACMLEKLTNDRNRNPCNPSTVPLEFFQNDLAGPIDPVSCDGFIYAIAFTDDYSGASFVYVLKKR